jgi:phenylacetate-coenzyme A ligase PaaK-like adenylate-forming protein
MPSHFGRLSWSPDRLAAERVRRLRELVRTAITSSTWHRARLADVDLERLDEESLRALPVMTKNDLMSNFDEIVTDRRLSLELANAHLERLERDGDYLLDEFNVIASGGSSGRRGVFIFGWDAWTTFQASVIRYVPRRPDRAGRSGPVAVVAAAAASHATAALTLTFSEPGEVVRLPVTLPVSEIVDGLNAAQPSGLSGYPSILRELAARALAGELSIAPGWVRSTSEPLTAETREAVAEAWGAPISNCWGTSEAGIAAIGCLGGDGMHLSDDLVSFEFVDEAGRSVPPGTMSAKTYVTNLFNPALPLVRYELTDQVTLLGGACPCGSTHRRVADIQGRLDDSFIYERDAVVHAHVFRSALSRQPCIIEYQITQTPRGADILVISSSTDSVRQIERGLERDLRRLGLPEPLVNIVPVDRLDRLPSGKLQRFVPLSATAARVAS